MRLILRTGMAAWVALSVAACGVLPSKTTTVVITTGVPSGGELTEPETQSGSPQSEEAEPERPDDTSTASTSAGPQTLQEALELVKPAVAKVNVSSWTSDSMTETSYCGVRTGTAFAVTPTLLVTAAHVVEGRDRVRVTSGLTTQPGAVVGYDRDKDVALIQVEHELPGSLTLRTDVVAPGDPVATYGYADGKAASYVAGTVNRLDQKAQVGEYFMTRLLEVDFAAQPGNSGGPVFTIEGGVVGLVDAGDDGPGHEYAVSAETIALLVAQWAGNPTRTDEAETSCQYLANFEAGPDTEPTSEAVESAALTLMTYYQAVNDADYSSALAQLANPGSLEAFQDGVETSEISNLEYLSTMEEAGEPVIEVSFTSRQEAGKGPKDRPDETCTQWRIRYQFEPRDNMWLIGKVGPLLWESQADSPCY